VAPSDTVAPFIIQSRGGTESGGADDNGGGGASGGGFQWPGSSHALPGGNIAINFTDAAGEPAWPLAGRFVACVIEVSVGGQIRMCDPAFPIDAAGDAQACT
jgi:hypothetical protein